jgi:hypothetical protein
MPPIKFTCCAVAAALSFVVMLSQAIAQRHSNISQETLMGNAPDHLMAALAEDASYLRPTLFSVYGVDRTGTPFLGWGMQIGEKEAYYVQPGSSMTWVSTSAEQVHATLNRLGEARLTWLED